MDILNSKKRNKNIGRHNLNKKKKYYLELKKILNLKN
jgi:hypothetical protein